MYLCKIVALVHFLLNLKISILLTMERDNSTPKRASLWQLFYTFGKIGAFTIGGGYAMIPLIEREVVTNRQWIDNDEFLDMLVLSQTAPGILAMNISILVGNRARGKWGAAVSALGSALPSFVIILLFALYLSRFRDIEWVEKMFRAIRPAVVALIASPVFKLAKTAKVSIKTVWIPVVAALLIWLLGVSPIYIILGAAALGLVWGWYQRRRSAK